MSNNINKVFIATSLDGFISDKNDNIDWLHSIPNPEMDDMGYMAFINQVDGIVMGRNTFETVCGFDIEWPYEIPVFVLSNRLSDLPQEFKNKAEIVKGALHEVVESLNHRGYKSLYIDGGKTIQSFLQEDLIDEITITRIPILLGGGTPLFGLMDNALQFECIESKIYLGQVVQNVFKRKRI